MKPIELDKDEGAKRIEIEQMGSALGAALKAAYLAGESPAPGIACLPG